MILAVIYLLGAIHGGILALVLAQKDENKLPNKILASMMIVFSVDLSLAALQLFGLLKQYTFLIGIDYPVTLLYGPLLYLYVKTMRDGRSILDQYDYLHFIPFCLLVLYMLPFYMEPGWTKINFLANPESVSAPYKLDMINHLKITHVLIYIGGVIYMINLYRKKIKNSFSNIEKVKLNWLQYFIGWAVFVAGIGAVINFLPTSSPNILIGMGEGIYNNVTLLSTTLFVYGIGYMGLYQPEVFTREMEKDISGNIQSNSNRAVKVDEQREQYQKSGLDKREAQRYAEKLYKTMEEKKLYRNSDLKLSDLAEELDISSHNLTEVINSYIGKNFYDFVNSYRIEEVKRNITGPGSKDLTLLAVGLNAGFNSKSTFNAVFKKQTGMTPSQFRKQQQNI